MATKFITVKGSSTLAETPFYKAVVQHERTMSRKETYNYCAEKTGYTPTAVRAAFLALREYAQENAKKGNITFVDGVSSLRNYPKGAFASLTGPWVTGKNYLMVESIEMDPFKSALAGIIPVNNTEGAKPAINTVFDETTGVYDIITGTDPFSIGGVDLAPDVEKDDEGVSATSSAGVETWATITHSDLQNVKAAFATALTPGEYTLSVYTRSGLGSEFGVKKATRKITIA